VKTAVKQSPPGKFYKAAVHQLDGIVIMIEFTLISVVAGLTLFPLMDNSAPLISGLNYEFWLYILTDLVLTMFFWTVVIGHALTFVGWPIDITHNLMYMGLFLALGIQIHFLAAPLVWFAMCTVVAFVAGLLARYDLALIARRARSAEEASAQGLYAAASKRQRLHIYSSIFSIVSIGLATVLIYRYPDFFIRQHGHLIPIGAVLIWTLLLLANEFRMFRGLRAGIVDLIAERLELQGHAPGDAAETGARRQP
jgi:hypothetical protein